MNENVRFFLKDIIIIAIIEEIARGVVSSFLFRHL